MRHIKKALAIAVTIASIQAIPQVAMAANPSESTYPLQPVRLIVGFSPGGGTDIVARAISEKLTQAWGKPVVVENRAGAGGNIASDMVAKAQPDGYTLLMGTTNTHTINPSIYANLSFDTVKDFTPITSVAVTPMVLVVNAALPVNNVDEFIAYSKSQGDQLSVGSAGTGSAGHLSVEMFKEMTGAALVHIPYKGSAPAITDLIGNQIPAMFAPAAPLLPHLKTGRVKALAVTTLERSPFMPDVLTLDEVGVSGFNTNSWFGLFAPAGTPENIVAQVHRDVARELEDPAVQEALARQALTPVGNAPDAFATQIKEEKMRYSKILSAAGIQPQ